MYCPHCSTSNLPGAATCTNCRAPLGGDAATLIGELTPPGAREDMTLDGTTRPPQGEESNVTLDGSSMAIPTAWSVPASGKEAASFSAGPIQPGSILANRYE